MIVLSPKRLNQSGRGTDFSFFLLLFNTFEITPAWGKIIQGSEIIMGPHSSVNVLSEMKTSGSLITMPGVKTKICMETFPIPAYNREHSE